MDEEILRFLEEIGGSELFLKLARVHDPYRTAPTEADIDLIREENARAIREEEERVMQRLREEAYRSGVDVPPDADMQRLREAVYRVPSSPRVDVFDPAVGGSMATTRDDTLSLLFSLLR